MAFDEHFKEGQRGRMLNIEQKIDGTSLRFIEGT
jgi:hypothetical protein